MNHSPSEWFSFIQKQRRAGGPPLFSSLRQEAPEDAVLGLLLGEAQGFQLQKLVPGNLADGRLVNQLGFGAVGGDGGDEE